MSEPTTSLVFSALADPNRRTIMQLLVRGDAATATSLSAELDISRQAVSKHLGLLAAAGLAQSTRSGRETIYRSDPRPLTEVNNWIAAVMSQWDARLDALKAVSMQGPARPQTPADSKDPANSKHPAG